MAPAAVLLGSSAGTGIAMALAGIAAVLVISAFFYAIGRGEDRDRAQGPPAARTQAPPDGEPAPGDRATRPQLPASARRRRRR